MIRKSANEIHYGQIAHSPMPWTLFFRKNLLNLPQQKIWTFNSHIWNIKIQLTWTEMVKWIKSERNIMEHKAKMCCVIPNYDNKIFNNSNHHIKKWELQLYCIMYKHTHLHYHKIRQSWNIKNNAKLFPSTKRFAKMKEHPPKD